MLGAPATVVDKYKPDILAAAQRMRERFGERAQDEVGLRILELTEHGEDEPAEFWRRVAEAVAALEKEASRKTRH